MSASPLADAKQAWATTYAGLSKDEINSRVRGFTVMVRGIAGDGILPLERFAELMELEIERAREVVARLFAAGIQSDESGNIVGAGLTTLETRHKMRVGGKELYAWCALDTLFIPGLLGESAYVESACPSSGEVIRLTVSPEAIEEAEPSSTWLSVVLPGGASQQLGPASPT